MYIHILLFYVILLFIFVTYSLQMFMCGYTEDNKDIPIEKYGYFFYPRWGNFFLKIHILLFYVILSFTFVTYWLEGCVWNYIADNKDIFKIYIYIFKNIFFTLFLQFEPLCFLILQVLYSTYKIFCNMYADAHVSKFM